MPFLGLLCPTQATNHLSTTAWNRRACSTSTSGSSLLTQGEGLLTSHTSWVCFKRQPKPTRPERKLFQSDLTLFRKESHHTLTFVSEGLREFSGHSTWRNIHVKRHSKSWTSEAALRHFYGEIHSTHYLKPKNLSLQRFRNYVKARKKRQREKRGNRFSTTDWRNN